MTTLSTTTRFLTGVALAGALAGCMNASSALPPQPAQSTEALARMKDNIDAMEAPVPVPPPALTVSSRDMPELKGVGFSQVSAQPGKTLNEKRLLAIRAARIEAMRDLVEQVHGIHLTSETTLRDAIVTDDRIRGLVEGELRGARTVRITPKDADTFVVELALDPDTVKYILRAARLGV